MTRENSIREWYTDRYSHQEGVAEALSTVHYEVEKIFASGHPGVQFEFDEQRGITNQEFKSEDDSMVIAREIHPDWSTLSILLDHKFGATSLNVENGRVLEAICKSRDGEAGVPADGIVNFLNSISSALSIETEQLYNQ